MKFDDTGPVTVKEWKSLLIFIVVVAAATGVIWYFARHPAKPGATPVRPVPVDGWGG